MNDPTRKSENAEDHFAKRLAKKHEQMIADGEPASRDRIPADDDDDRVQSAMLVLEMLEQWNLQPVDSDARAQAGVETQDNPSTQKSGQAFASVSSKAFESQIPNLERLGRFEILEQIGRGGFGIVVRARDPKLDRVVAIKIPRLETALSDNSRQRFEREAKAAAALHHPGVVSVFETGSQQGIDFIVAELIDGENLATHLARGNTFSPLESAELVAELADAVEHAHQRNVLHRDIKPSNILLANEESGFRPLIADFGLAAMNDLQDFTQTGAALGTPAYMSPEQATGNKNRIGPGTDIYGIGAVLYELLTQKSPFAELPIVELLNSIHRRDPVPPRSIHPDIPRDLESICLKCLEKDPDLRYCSAQELQADLRRFINGTPVVARSITPVDRGARWIARNPFLATAGASALVFLVAALIASAWGWRSTSNALKRERVAKSDARQTVNQYFTDVAENDLLDMPGMLPVREKLLSSALGYYQRIVNDSTATQEDLMELERAYFRVGKIQSDLGRHNEAIEAFEFAMALQNQILSQSGDDPDLKARQFETLRRAGQSHVNSSQYDSGLVSLDSAIEGQRQLVAAAPARDDWQVELTESLRAKANAFFEQGNFEQEIPIENEVIERLVDLNANDPENSIYLRKLAKAYSQQANAMGKTGDLARAAASADLAIEICRGLVNSPDPSPLDSNSLALALLGRAGKHLVNRETEPAVALLEEAAKLNEAFVQMFPNSVDYRRQRLDILSGLGFCYSHLKLTDRVIEVLESSVEQLEQLLAGPEGIPNIEYDLAVAQMNLGSTLAQQTENQLAANQLLVKADAHFKNFLETTPDFFQGKMAAAFCQLSLAANQNELGNHEQALKCADRSIEALEAIETAKPGVPQVIQNLAGAYHNRAIALELLGRIDESVPVWRTAVEYKGPFLIRSKLRLAAALAQTGEPAEPLAILTSLDKEPAVKTRYLESLARAQASLAKCLSESDDTDSAEVVAMADQAFESLRIWFQKPGNVNASNVKKIRTSTAYQFLLQRDDAQRLLDDVAAAIAARDAE